MSAAKRRQKRGRRDQRRASASQSRSSRRLRVCRRSAARNAAERTRRAPRPPASSLFARTTISSLISNRIGGDLRFEFFVETIGFDCLRVARQIDKSDGENAEEHLIDDDRGVERPERLRTERGGAIERRRLRRGGGGGKNGAASNAIFHDKIAGDEHRKAKKNRHFAARFCIYFVLSIR